MPRKNRIEVPCAQCGTPIERPAHKLRDNKNQFCSQSCHMAFKTAQGTTQVACAQCGTLLRRTHWRAAHTANHFCNTACKSAYRAGRALPNRERKIEMTCATCGKTFMRKQCRAGVRVYCDHLCAADGLSELRRGELNPAWAGGDIDWYGPNWREQRRAARKRDGYRCQSCNLTEKKHGRELEVHHMIPFRIFGIERYREANHLSNLISLCRTCHRAAERHAIPIQPKLL